MKVRCQESYKPYSEHWFETTPSSVSVCYVFLKNAHEYNPNNSDCDWRVYLHFTVKCPLCEGKTILREKYIKTFESKEEALAWAIKKKIKFSE